MDTNGHFVFGIRHHGPGSARSLREALAELKPDCILIEGPPEGEPVLPFAVHAELKPPVALLVYDPERPQRAVYYPFAVFSPEWQAIQFGLQSGTPVRFIDLPQSIQFGLAEESESKPADAESAPSVPVAPEADLWLDPLDHMARAAGYADSEPWWEHLVELRRNSADVFGAVLEAMAALRGAALESSLQRLEPEREARREAHMRQAIRAARKEGCARVAVVCGAWHTPALAQLPPAKDDAALLKGLPKRKAVATLIPWTYSRLASASGYGAGVASPGWYDFLWTQGESGHRDVVAPWLARVARLLRGEDLDASSASLIEAVRLAEALAALRGRPLPGLPELNEATRAVLCGGDDLPLRLIAEKLIVSDRLGEVPDDTPAVPLAQDLAREQKRLRFPPEAAAKQIDLDLRKPIDLERSHLLHRLRLLGVPWGEPLRQRGTQKGTFHELWTVQWQPEFAVGLIEAGVWGQTLPLAAGARVRHDADGAPDLPALTGMLDATLLADLPDAAEHLMARLQAVAAVASDVGHLMDALPPLANILRYGNVRNTDAALVAGLVNGLVARVCVGLPGACGSLSDEAAEQMFARFLATHAAVGLLQDAGHTTAWNGVLGRLADTPHLHGLVAGRCCRLLHEGRQLAAGEAARRFGLALSSANAPTQAAAWVDGFLRDSGLLLLHDGALWQVLDDWVVSLTADHFTAVLPLLRRTFSGFPKGERRQMGARVATGARHTAPVPARVERENFDEERANQALPLLAQLLGLTTDAEEDKS